MQYTAFLPEVILRAPTVPQNVAIGAIRNACIHFCRETGWLINEPATVPLVVGQSAYTIPAPAGTTIAQVSEVYVNGQRISPVAEEVLAGAQHTDWRTDSGQPRQYTMFGYDKIILHPTPDANSTGPISCITWLQPSRTSTSVDDSVYEWWLEAIAFGALKLIYETPGQPYSNPQQAMTSAAQFNMFIDKARARRNTGLTRGPASVQMPQLI